MPRLSSKSSAFTLIELLTVIAIIGVLAGITLAVTQGVGDKSRKARAQAELGVLASAMEEYRRYFGDYLHVSDSLETATDDNKIDPTPEASEGDAPYNPLRNDRAFNLFRALNGGIGPDLSVVTRQISKDGTRAEKYTKFFVRPVDFTLERKNKSDQPVNLEPLPTPNPSNSGNDPDFANAFLDPWGNRYIYFYKDLSARGAWKRDGFVLLSAGPDGKVKFKGSGDRRAGDVIDVAPANAAATDPRRVNDDNIYYAP